MDRKQDKKSEPIEHRPGKQQDDNIDDLGRRPDGTRQDQPGVDIDELTENVEEPDRD